MENKNKQIWEIGQKYEIPLEGSLAIFAVGYRGVKAWRELKRDASKNKKNQNNSEKEK